VALRRLGTGWRRPKKLFEKVTDLLGGLRTRE
jgi:hypothetical protein